MGCAFCARCDDAMRICVEKDPATYMISHTQTAKCWLHDSARKGVKRMKSNQRSMLIEVEHLQNIFTVDKGQTLKAVNDLTFRHS